MRPKKPSCELELYQSHLEQILNHDHALYKLAHQIDWAVFEAEFGALYHPGKGRPGLATRLMAGLHYLKHTFDESDESVVERFLENPYWQYFCGCDYFQHSLPLDPSSLVRWRKRVGQAGMEKLLAETIEVAKRQKLIQRKDLDQVNVDTTVQEKAIAFPTDARLYHKMRVRLVREADKRDITLRQSYPRLGKRALARQGRYAHARQMRRAARETRKLRTYLGWVMRDVRRKAPPGDAELERLLALAERIYSQQKKSKNKVYSVHAPEVACIAKGKVHKKYEFGCKVGVVSTSKKNWIAGVEAYHGNPYDGHTLVSAIDQATRLTGWTPQEAFCDKGYQGHNRLVGTKVHLVGKRRKNLGRALKRWMKRRAAIEPIIGHLKADHRMNRNHYRGQQGDAANALLSAAGFNLRKLLAFFLRLFARVLFALKHAGAGYHFTPPAHAVP
ncbi:MAG: IS5 family transposase [SAR324 cluster bacterium]|nr:IS5 family transposase [SAR324 cluster bacterium]